MDDTLDYGLKLCKNTTTDNLYIYSYDFSDNICFQSKDYVVYQGKTDDGYDICALIDRNGLIYETASDDEWIDTIENNGLYMSPIQIQNHMVVESITQRPWKS